MARTLYMALLAAGAVLLVALVRPQPASAEYCRPVMPDHATDVRGYTFRGTVSDIRTEGASPESTYITLAIVKVYADADSGTLLAGDDIELYSNPCDGFALVGLRVNEDVLISTASLDGDGPRSWNSAVWRVEADELDLAVLDTDRYDKVWYTMDRRIAEAHTLRAALSLAAPTAIGMPDTATEGAPASPAIGSTRALAGLVTVLFVTFALGVRPRRSRAARPHVRVTSPTDSNVSLDVT